MNMKVKVLGGSAGGLEEMLGEVLGGALGHGGELKPAGEEQLRPLIESLAQPKFKVGDIVTLHEHGKGRFKFPAFGDNVIVTQVLDQPYRGGEVSSSDPSVSNDIAIGFTCPQGHIHEFLYDSRMFKRVGTILQ